MAACLNGCCRNRRLQEASLSEGFMKQFVAMTDDMLYRTDGPPGPIVPYQCGVFCWHRLREEVAEDTVAAPAQARVLAQEDRVALSA